MCKVKRYHRSIRNLADRKSDTIFDNCNSDHTVCLFAAIFESCKDVRIFSNSFDSLITERNNFVKPLTEFLKDPETSLKLVLVDNDVNSSTFKILQDSIKKGYPGEIYFLNEKNTILDSIKSNNNNVVYNFCLGDKGVFRISKNPSSYKAKASFNQEEIVSEYDSVFDTLINQSTLQN